MIFVYPLRGYRMQNGLHRVTSKTSSRLGFRSMYVQQLHPSHPTKSYIPVEALNPKQRTLNPKP